MYEATVFLLFWLHLYSKSFKNVRKLLSASCSLAVNIPKQTFKLLVILPLALCYHLSIIIGGQNMLFHGQIGKVIRQIST